MTNFQSSKWQEINYQHGKFNIIFTILLFYACNVRIEGRQITEVAYVNAAAVQNYHNACDWLTGCWYGLQGACLD